MNAKLVSTLLLVIVVAAPWARAQVPAPPADNPGAAVAGQPPLLQQAPPGDTNKPFGMTEEIGRQSLGTLEIDLHAVVALPLATILGAAAGARPKRRGTPKRSSQVVQTQIILAIIGALVMIVVGTSLARAFGVVGAAGLVRYRAKIDDPKDAGVMLTTLAVGLGCGIGLYGLALFATVFLMAVLWVIESFEPSARKQFILEIKAKEAPSCSPGSRRCCAAGA